MYDRQNTGFYVDPASTSNFNRIDDEGTYSRWWEPKGVGGNSGNGGHAYRIFQEGGAWDFPYPDMRIAFHTGIKLGANGPSYGGVRIFDDYPMGTQLIQLNGGSNYSFWNTWMNLSGSHGMYSGVNGAHLYPNNGSYGSWKMDGTRNGWAGIEFSSGLSFMANANNSGFHWNGVGWRLYVESANLYMPGNVVAYWSDRRLKENIKPLELGEGLDVIMKFVPSRFNWRKEAEDVTQSCVLGGTEEVSIIAQEAQEVLPIAVAVNKTGRVVIVDGEEVTDHLSIIWDKISPYMVQAIKDLKYQLDLSNNEISELRSLSQQLIAEIQELKKLRD
jgi:hypothetical protein